MMSFDILKGEKYLIYPAYGCWGMETEWAFSDVLYVTAVVKFEILSHTVQPKTKTDPLPHFLNKYHVLL